MREGEYRKAASSSDVEELREVLHAVSEFLKELTPTVKDLIEAIFGGLKGDILGREVGQFYRSLLNAGMPEDEAIKLTEEFLKRRMAVMDVAKVISGFVPKRKVVEEEREKTGDETGRG